MINEDGLEICGGEMYWIDEMNGQDFYACMICKEWGNHDEFCQNSDTTKMKIHIRNKKIDTILKDK